MSRMNATCFKCKKTFPVHRRYFFEKYPNFYLCFQCQKSNPKLAIAHREWRSLVSYYRSTCEAWKDPVNGFHNFITWRNNQQLPSGYFEVRNIKQELSPDNCFYSEQPGAFTRYVLYNKWKSIQARVLHSDSSTQYSKRGVKICSEWLGDNGFDNFYEWSVKEKFKFYLTIDRIDPNGDYEPGNCRWTDYYIQTVNRIFTTNKTGYNGVRWYPQRRAFYAYCHYEYNTYPIGYFPTAYDGSIAYDYFLRKNNLPKKYNHNWSRRDIEKEFQKVMYRSFLASRERNKNQASGYLGVVVQKNTIFIALRINGELKYLFIPGLKKKKHYAIIRDYIILKLGLKIKELIHLKMDKSYKELYGYLLNFPKVLFEEEKKKQLFRIAEKIIKKHNIDLSAFFK